MQSQGSINHINHRALKIGMRTIVKERGSNAYYPNTRLDYSKKSIDSNAKLTKSISSARNNEACSI
jgi:hypothetical protein